MVGDKCTFGGFYNHFIYVICILFKQWHAGLNLTVKLRIVFRLFELVILNH